MALEVTIFPAEGAGPPFCDASSRLLPYMRFAPSVSLYRHSTCSINILTAQVSLSTLLRSDTGQIRTSPTGTLVELTSLVLVIYVGFHLQYA